MPGKYADGVYSAKPWLAHEKAAYPPQGYLGPFASNQERLMTQAMAVGSMTSEEVQEYVRPNLPQVELFPDKYGFVTTEIGIKDIVELTGRPRERHDYSGEPTTQESTSRNALGNTLGKSV